MITTARTLRYVVGVIEAADAMLLLHDHDAITSHSPTLLNVEGGTTQATSVTVPMDLPIPAGEVIKNVGGHGIALIFG